MTAASLQQAIDRGCAENSLYWAFRHGRTRAFAVEQDVEVRIDVPAEGMDTAEVFHGWSVAGRDTELGAVFLRRRQSLQDDDLRRLFADALTLAHERGGQFHSWAHGADLRPSPEKVV